MTWRVLFHPLVEREDLPALDGAARAQVLKAIRKKLTTNPAAYGEPLRRELFGYWKLRVGAYRVIYRIRGSEVVVLILKIGMRKDSQAYSEMLVRAKRRL
ncbi:MAG: type II toxin-antitoxin system RelE/ParE family toxin [Elusimicrobia bacterium]|nr:type II toxin-antitoxin system RelE/ParE family toxin [Elusimicrobiota bacterium]